MSDRQKLASLQYLRALAAGIVVVSHAGAQALYLFGTGKEKYDFGAMGVDIFFILSGFIMMLVSERAESRPGEFLWKRFTRIMPVYWFAVLFYLGFILLVPGHIPWPSGGNLLQALVLWAPTNKDQLISVAWTLRFEWVFYASFALALAISHRWRAHLAGLILLLVIAALKYYPGPHELGLQMRGWSGAYYEFILGLALYTFWRGHPAFSGEAPEIGRWASAALVVGLIAVSTVVLHAFGPTGALKPLQYEKQLAWGLPALAVFVGWLYVFSRVTLTGWAGATMLAIGDSSFMLYLVHVPVVAALRTIPALKPLWVAGGEWVYMTVATLASLLLAWVLFRLVEVPLLKLIRAGLARRNRIAAATP